MTTIASGRLRSDSAARHRMIVRFIAGPNMLMRATFPLERLMGRHSREEIKMTKIPFCLLLLAAAGCATVPPVPGRDSVLAVDDRERAMVAASDVAGLQRLAHRNLRINAPIGRVLSREQFFKNLASGEIAAEAFERTAEDVSISGNVAVVMGRETFTPRAASELGRQFGSRPLQRRYTNVYVWEDGHWQWLARHANVVISPRP